MLTFSVLSLTQEPIQAQALESDLDVFHSGHQNPSPACNSAEVGTADGSGTSHPSQRDHSAAGDASGHPTERRASTSRPRINKRLSKKTPWFRVPQEYHVLSFIDTVFNNSTTMCEMTWNYLWYHVMKTGTAANTRGLRIANNQHKRPAVCIRKSWDQMTQGIDIDGWSRYWGFIFPNSGTT